MMRQVMLATGLLAAAAPALEAQGPAPASKLLVATGKEIMQVVSPGILICEGGQPTGLLAPLCSPSTKRILIRNAIAEATYQDVTGTAAALVGGKATIVTQCNLDDKYFGFCWGTWEWAAPGQAGKWEGSWSSTTDYAAAVGAVSSELCGYGGKLEGLQMKYVSVYPGGMTPATFTVRLVSQ